MKRSACAIAAARSISPRLAPESSAMFSATVVANRKDSWNTSAAPRRSVAGST